MKRAIVMAVALAFSAAGCAGDKAAKAEIINSNGEKIGRATFREKPDGVEIALNVSKLPPGAHAFHIHALGKADPPDFKTSGGHFNPEGREHGVNNPKGHHAGDLPNITVGPDGTGKLTVLIRGITLGPDKPGIAYSLFKEGGTSVVIHASPDDNKTDPAGNAGDRIAAGVIKR